MGLWPDLEADGSPVAIRSVHIGCRGAILNWKQLRMNDADALGVTVADDDRAIAVDENSVRTIHGAFEGIALLAVACRAGASDQTNGAGPGFNHANDLVFGIGKVDVAIGSNRDAFGAGESCFASRAVIASVSLFAGASEVMDGSFGQIELKDFIPLAERENEVA